MNTVLVVLAVLGIGAIVISAYVFAATARRYVSEEDKSPVTVDTGTSDQETRLYVVRSDVDRRANAETARFPMMINGVVVEQERRTGERRTHAG